MNVGEHTQPPALGTSMRDVPTRPLAARGAIQMVRLYQIMASSLRRGQPSPCRYVPSCSTYALEALESFGARRGGWLAARRLARCRPFGGAGFDPVPVSLEP